MIDPDFLAELDRFDAALERETTALVQGEQQSPRVGEGLTFSDYRRYAPGDDTRLLDWKLYARTDQFYVKQFEEERNLTVHVLVDTSGSMDYGDGGAHKFEYGAKVGLGFAYLTAEDHNDFRFATFGDAPERLDAGRSNRGEVLAAIDQLNERSPAGETTFERSLAAYADRIRTRSLAVVVSDFLGDPDDVEAGVAALARNDVDVLLVRVVAPGEREPEAVGDTLFVDPETDDERRSYFSGSLAERYRSRLDEHVETVADRVETLGADHVLLDTGADFFDGFARAWFE